MVFAFISLLSLASAWVWGEGHSGPCPHIKKQDKFDINLYTGEYYLVARSTVGPDSYGQCGYVEYTGLNENVVSATYSFRLEGGFSSYDYTLVFDTVRGHYGSYTLIYQSQTFDLHLIETDWETYFVSYVCNKLGGNLRQDSFQVFARDPSFQLTPQIINRATELGFGTLDLVNHDEDFCYPSPV